MVVKVVYDRGTASQLIHNHAPVPPEKWGSVGLPRPEDLKGIRMEVVNYHRPPLGTFHAKYLVVDRKIACINSNNVQDRPNIEMCLHLEGQVVESFYDVALFSWANKLDPPLPLLKRTPTHRDDYKFGEENEHLTCAPFLLFSRHSLLFTCRLIDKLFVLLDIESHFASAAALTPLEQQELEAQERGGAQPNGMFKSQSGDSSLLGQAARAAVAGSDEGVHGKDELIGMHPTLSSLDAADKSESSSSGNEIAGSDKIVDGNEGTNGGVRPDGCVDGYPSEHDLEHLQKRQKEHPDSEPGESANQSSYSSPSTSSSSSFPSSYPNSSTVSVGPGLLRSGKTSFASSRASNPIKGSKQLLRSRYGSFP